MCVHVCVCVCVCVCVRVCVCVCVCACVGVGVYMGLYYNYYNITLSLVIGFNRIQDSLVPQAHNVFGCVGLGNEARKGFKSLRHTEYSPPDPLVVVISS